MKLLYTILLFVALLFINTQSHSQKMVWAKQVNEVTSEYSKNRHSAKEVLGVPNVGPIGMSSTYAWRVQPNAIDDEGVETAAIEVGFDGMVQAQHLAVFESYNPGAVSEILIFNEQNEWKSVYSDTSAVERTAYRPFESAPNGYLSKNASTTRRAKRFFRKDSLYLNPAKYNVINVYFDSEKVQAVRVVMNLFAIDGWNEIDAIGLSNDKTPIKYPEVSVVRDPLFANDKTERLGPEINTEYTEIKPVVDGNANRMYFVRTNYPENSHDQTQDVWYSDRMYQEVESCKYNCEQKFEDRWQQAKPYRPFNNIIPNGVLGFSTNGKYMILNNRYEEVENNCDCDSVLKKSSTGLSISQLDTMKWTKAGTDAIKKVKKKHKTLQDFFINKDGNVLVASTPGDSVKQKPLSVSVFFSTGDSAWSSAHEYQNVQESIKLNLPEYINPTYENLILKIEDNKIVGCSNVGWSNPKTLLIKDFENKSNYIDINITDDGKTMFIAYDNGETYGGRDIFVSKLQEKDIWSKPENLGTTINTISDDCSPFLDSDNETFYFASAGHHGYGDRDIYVCRRAGAEWDKWTTPKNLGKKINTVNSDAFFTIDQKTDLAYFSSTDNATGCTGKSDIHSIRMLRPINLKIVGKVYDCLNKGRTLDANIIMRSIDKDDNFGLKYLKTESDKQDGGYLIEITEMIDSRLMTDLAIMAEKENFVQTTPYGQCDTLKYKRLTPIVEGRNITIEQDLYMMYEKLIDPKEDEPKTLDKLNIKPEDTDLNDDIEVEEEKTTPVGIVGGDLEIPVSKRKSCNTLFYEGNMYLISPIFEDEDEATISKIDRAYSKQFSYNNHDLKNDAKFKTFLNDYFANQTYNAKDTVKVHIVSSASKVPTLEFRTNEQLAMERANTAERNIRNYLKTQEGFNMRQLSIAKETHVQGPDYAKDKGNEDKYIRYQYVRIWVVICRSDD